MLGGLGALMAVLLLVFRDTILSFVASLQLASYDTIRVGDWIEMPQYGADGDVIELSLHTVKIQNFDKTITALPTHKLIEEPFKNWRGMEESGGRRIKRSFFIDMSSIRFLTGDELDSLENFVVLRDYIRQKREELAAANKEIEHDPHLVANARRLTNSGTFRAYLVAYLRQHSKIHQGMTLIVRQLDPTPRRPPLRTVYVYQRHGLVRVRRHPVRHLRSHFFHSSRIRSPRVPGADRFGLRTPRLVERWLIWRKFFPATLPATSLSTIRASIATSAGRLRLKCSSRKTDTP